MARVRPGRNLKGTAPLTGAVSFRLQDGRTYAQKWPRRRGKPRHSYQSAGLERLRVAQRAVKTMSGPDVTPMAEGLQRFLDAHRGVRGTAAIRLRDWLTQVVYGRAWAIQMPNGRVMYPAQVQRDCSDFLDWTEPRLGSLLTRTDEGWLPTVQCRAGRILTCMGDGADPDACPPASIPGPHGAMGGTIDPERHETGVSAAPPPPETEEPALPEDLFERTQHPDYELPTDPAGLWHIKAQAMHAGGGQQDLLQRSGLSILDGYVEADVSQAQDGGVAMRVLDNDNYYFLAIRDNSSSQNPKNLNLFKKVNGGFTEITSAEADHPRGTTHTYRLQISGTTITCYFDGTELINTTDTSIQQTGGVAMRHYDSGTNTIFERFEWQDAA